MHFSLLAGAEISVRNLAKGTPKSEAWLKAVPDTLRDFADHIAAAPYLCVELRAWPHRTAKGKLAQGFTVRQKLELLVTRVNEQRWMTAWRGEFPNELCAFDAAAYDESCARLTTVTSDPGNYPIYLAAQEALRDEDPNVDGLCRVRMRGVPLHGSVRARPRTASVQEGLTLACLLLLLILFLGVLHAQMLIGCLRATSIAVSARGFEATCVQCDRTDALHTLIGSHPICARSLGVSDAEAFRELEQFRLFNKAAAVPLEAESAAAEAVFTALGMPFGGM